MSSVSKGKKKLIERAILLLAIVAAVGAVMLANVLYDFYLEKKYPKSNLYGTWTEQNVASYSAEAFVVTPAGVAIDGGVVDTHYSWNGTYLEYQVGDKTRRFKVLNEELTELQLISEPHYQPVYRLSENY
ncbi:DUF2850 domain-containing protein [Vibrio sinaloensis]|uniref:DUF2850 domain-containing protein n=1 Tax=Photobacterium sp. (strain ATCC 43367) TaxID=379097 RepID=UPI0022AF11D5|nr:DUF2850 domain-containing protein [Vibrio sinaloensis]MCZ4295408.1 DUF2850 domain-containing protein [Vibrio sinaloensis]